MASKNSVKVGDKFNHWTVVEVLNQGYQCLCECDCKKHTSRVVNTYFLIYGKSKSCGCVRKKREHGKPRKEKYQLKVGDTFGKLTIEELDAIQNYKSNYLHKCKCTCGNTRYVSPWDLVNGKVYSCSKCVRRSDYHYDSGSRFYNIWARMRSRCLNQQNPDYKNYGGRGIGICHEWGDYENFKEDMYASYLEHVEKYGEKDTSIDRIDVNGNYEPSNCRWATNLEQQYNKRNTVLLIDYNGETHTLKEWSKIKGISLRNLVNRHYHLKWPDVDVLNKEVKSRHGKTDKE